MHAVTKPMPVCPVSDRALHVKSAVLKWVGLEDKMMADGRAFRKCSQTNINEFEPRPEIGMSLEAGIVFKLQKDGMERKASPLDPGVRKETLDLVPGPKKQAAQVQPELLHHADVSVRPEVRILSVQGHDAEMIEGTVEHMLSHISPVAGRWRIVQPWMPQGLPHGRDRGSHQGRIAV